MPRDYYEVLGRRARRRRGRGQDRLPQARPRAAPRRQRPRPRGGGEVQGGGGSLRGALRPGAAPRLRRLRPRRACAATASRRGPASARSTTSSRPSSAARGSASRAGPMRGQDLVHQVEITAIDAMLGDERQGADATRASARSSCRPGPSTAPSSRCAATGCRGRTAGPPGDMVHRRPRDSSPATSPRSSEELARKLGESLEPRNLRSSGGEEESFFSAHAPRLRLIRLAVRCRPEQAEIVLAELTVLAPNGVEEERGPGYVEYAIYGGEGELPELGEVEAAAGDGLVEVVATEVPDDWADRWQDFHKPLLVGERLWLRPSWEEPREGAIDLVVDPGRAFGTGAHPTTRLCLGFLLELEAAGEARGPLDRPRHRLRRPRDRRRQARLGPGPRLRPRAGLDRGGGRQRCGQRRRDRPSSCATSARACPPLAPTTVANMTAPVLRELAAQLTVAGVGGGLAEPPRCCSDEPSPAPSTLVLLGPAARRAGRDRRRVRRLPAWPRPTAAVDGDWAAPAAPSLRDSAAGSNMFCAMRSRRSSTRATRSPSSCTSSRSCSPSARPSATRSSSRSRRSYPRATPAILAGVQKCDRYLVNPGMIVLLLAGIYLLRPTATWTTSDAFISVGFLAIIVLFGLQHAFFQPQVAQGEGARRTRPEGAATRSATSSKRSGSGSARSARWPGSSSSSRSSS